MVVPGGFDPGGQHGLIPALVSLAQELARRHAVHVFASAGLAGAARYRLGAVEVTQRPGRETSAALSGALWRWWRAAGPFDVVHAFWANHTALLAAAFARLRGVRCVVSLGGGEAVWLPDLAYGGAGTVRSRAVTQSALRLADAITAGSAFVTRLLPDALGRRVSIVPLGVDGGHFAAPPARPAGPPWRLVHVANLNTVKDQPTLLAALRRAVDRLGDVHLDCVGEDTLQGQMQAHARALGVEAHVAFHGFVPQDQLAAFYRRAHLHVLSSRHESQAVVVLEAAAAGLPTVGTRVGLVDTLAPHAAAAVGIRDAAALGDAIIALLRDQPAREAMGAAAQAFARAHDLAWTARRFEEIYRP
ncbi:MAG: glycosyltransferase family 4 protein [Polyangia bacterium]